MGVPSVLVDLILRVDPRRDDFAQVLWVCQELDGALGAAELVQKAVPYLLRWKICSDRRWAGVRPSTRHLVLSLVVGVEALIKLLDVAVSGNDRYYLSASKTKMGLQ